MIILTLFSSKLITENDSKTEDMYDALKGKGIVFCRGLIKDYDQQRGLFLKARFFEDNAWIEKENIRPEIVYDKSNYNINDNFFEIRNKISENYKFVNELEFSRILTDKWETYNLFPEFSPKTLLIENENDQSRIDLLNSDKIILKPRFGSKGEGILICEKAELYHTHTTFPYIAQELIVAKKGIQNVAIGLHDLRIMMKNEKPFHVSVRTPAPGKFMPNIAQGGAIANVGFEMVPDTAWFIVREVCKRFKDYKYKLFTIDLIFDDNGRPWILELNSHPGMTLENGEKENSKAYYQAFADFFMEL